MRWRGSALAVVIGLLLSVVGLTLLGGPPSFTKPGSTETQVASAASSTPSADSTSTLDLEPAPVNPSVTVAPTLVPVEVGGQEGKDMEDVLLLYDSSNVRPSDTLFCRIAGYYGLLCRGLALDVDPLTDASLRDENGAYLRLIGISSDVMLRLPSLLTQEELDTLKTAISGGGMHIWIPMMEVQRDTATLTKLMGIAGVGVQDVQDSRRDWTISEAAPHITREFTGQTIAANVALAQEDRALVLDPGLDSTVLITSTDDTGAAYPILAQATLGAGSAFVYSGKQSADPATVRFADLYYDYEFGSFAEVVPLMMVMRYAAGDEAWHNDHNYANLTIDDPSLTEPWNELSYKGLLWEMRLHNFHTTIAMHPKEWETSEPEVTELFRDYPDQFSLVQHGNEGDGYEFFRYSVNEGDTYEGQKLPARPFAEQEADIIEGLTRMAKHRSRTGIVDDRVMIFPWGIAPEQTLVLLKKYNYLATVNAVEVPLDREPPADWDYGMRPATLAFGNFPSLSRWCYQRADEFQALLPFFLFDFFIDQPVLFCTHAYAEDDLGTGQMDAFNPIADRVNAVSGGAEWRSLGHVLRHLYLEKENDDKSVDVQIYINHTVIENGSTQARDYHVSKLETGNVPISWLKVNDQPFPYTIEGDVLALDVRIPAGSTAEIRIEYSNYEP